VKNVCHSPLESCASVFYTKRHEMICKSTPRGGQCGFVLIGWVYLDLVIAREIVHEG
jgi:hypothetical protein